MTSSHRAVFAWDDADAVWLVEFPGLDGCHTFGATLDEARAHAREALQVWLDHDDVAVEEVVSPRSAATG